MNEPKTDLTEEISASLRAWGVDLDKFREKAKASADATRGDLSEVTGILRQTMANTKSILLDLQKSREPVSAELKIGFEKAWDEIEQAFARARQALRDSRKTASIEAGDDSYWLG